MVDIRDYGSTAQLDSWWQGLTGNQRARFRGLKAGDTFPSEALTVYSRASLVADTQRQGQRGVDHRVNDRLDAFLKRERGEQR
jgi:hypothetical protein